MSEHHHEHDEHCGCHEHHDHHHEHHHEHHREKTVLDFPQMTVSYDVAPHDAALALSASLEMKPGCQLPAQWLVDAMQAMAKSVEERGGVVGHIKSAVHNSEAEMHASVTLGGVPATVKGDDSLIIDEQSTVILVVIALCIEQEELEALVQEHLS